MAGAVVQSKTGAQNTPSTSVSATFDTPATAGNTLVMTVGADSSATPPAGWTQSAGCGQLTFLGHYLWWTVAAGGETFANYGLGSSAPSCWCTAELSGLSASPYDISDGQFAASTGTSYTTPAVAPTTGGRFLVGSMGFSLNNSFTDMVSWLNSFNAVAESHTTLGSGTRDQVGLATRSVTGDGSTTFSTGATSDAAGTPQARTGIILAFKEAVPSWATSYAVTIG